MINELSAARKAMLDSMPGEPLIEINKKDILRITDSDGEPRYFLRSDGFIALAERFADTEPLTALCIQEPETA